MIGEWYWRAANPTQVFDLDGECATYFSSMLISGAAAGLGIALVPAFLVQSQMAALGLVTPFDQPLVTDNAYYLVYPVEMRHSKPLEAFRGWLLAEAGAFRQQGGV